MSLEKLPSFFCCTSGAVTCCAAITNKSPVDLGDREESSTMQIGNRIASPRAESYPSNFRRARYDSIEAAGWKAVARFIAKVRN